MDVLFLTHSYPRHPGDAAGSFLLRLARALGDQGVRVRVVAPAAPGLPAAEVLDGIPVRRFRYAPRRHENLAYHGNMATLVRESWPARLALLSFLGAYFGAAVRERRAPRPAVVHAHWWFPGGLVGSWLSGATGIPLVTTMHGTDVRIARDVRVARAPFRRVLAASAAVTAVSRFLADEARAIAPSADPVVAPMPVATELFHPGAAGEGPGDGRGTDRLLFVGRLTRQKGVDRLLEALSRMRRAASLTVVGDGPEGPTLHRLASTLGMGERVRWLPSVPQPELAPLYREATAVVVPSHEEGLGLVAVEAMLSGAPVVAFDSGGLRDVVVHERTGLLVPAGDVDALAGALDHLLDPAAADMRYRLASAARERALATFSPQAVARRYADIYRQLSGPAGRHAA
ncbi:MAG TPA: glycosyltransferase [Gemmatimonadales bacterium]